MSSYKELLLKELFVIRNIHKNTKNLIFEDELFGGSSYFMNEIWSKMESLTILNEFCTLSECNTTFTSKFIKIQILWISTFHFLDFTNSMVEISTRSSSGWVIAHILDRTWSYLFPEKKHEPIELHSCLYP